jgi:hypothetical protein
VWNKNTSAGIKNWTAISISDNGQHLAACVHEGHIYRSSDYGTSWTELSSNGNQKWNSITLSADGKFMAASVYYGSIYTSSYTTTNIKQWSHIASSKDGRILAASVYNGYIYTSIDNGKTWNEHTSVGLNKWISLQFLKGNKLTAYSNNAIYNGVNE